MEAVTRVTCTGQNFNISVFDFRKTAEKMKKKREQNVINFRWYRREFLLFYIKDETASVTELSREPDLKDCYEK